MNYNEYVNNPFYIYYLDDILYATSWQ